MSVKAEVDLVSSNKIAYEIKQGENNKGKKIIPNENAGLVLLAIDLEQPSSCHQKYKVMDELHSDIFGRPGVTGARVVALWDAFQGINDALDQLDNKSFAHYTLTRYFLAYSVSRIIKDDPVGAKVMASLDLVVSNNKIGAFTSAFTELAILAANDLNAEISSDDDDHFDYKSDLKSSKWSKAMAARLLSQFKKDVARKKAESIEKVFGGLLKK